MASIDAKHYFKSYENTDNDFVSRPLGEIVPVHAKQTIAHLEDLLRGYENSAFVCGGFPSWLSGQTPQYGDIDIFCVNRTVFEAILSRVDQSNRVAKCERFVYGCTFNGLNIDIICLQDAKEVGWFRGLLGKQPKTMTIENVLETFDLSWSMVGIDFISQELVYHADFYLLYPYVNELRKKNYTKTVGRLEKYFQRRGKPCAPELIEAIQQELIKNGAEDPSKPQAITQPTPQLNQQVTSITGSWNGY